MAILPNEYRKYGGANITIKDVDKIAPIYKENNWPIPKYLLFIKMALEKGYKVTLYDAQTTVSKYVTVIHKNKKFKVRFSNHKPNYYREKNGECDFFVGVTNLHVTTTDDAWKATIKFLEN